MTYQQQIDWLTEHPEDIQKHWFAASGLFKLLKGSFSFKSSAGCLTTIRNSFYNSSSNNKVYINEEYNEELTEAIRADERLPMRVDDITVAHLPVFKEWQEKIDAMLTT